jgi:DNA polymerase-3 subunit delta'
MATRTDIPEAIRAATTEQPAAQLALSAAAAAPSHAYLFLGPTGSGKRDAARALAAELLADRAPDPDDARRRALADPSPHPDLVWLRPPGAQHLVEEVRERVIAAAAYRPFEGERRVFVIEDAEAMAEESQNALLKTLEEPHAFAHLILISAEPESVLETVRSRCRPVRFTRLRPEAVEAALAGEASGDELRAVSRLADGDAARARFLIGEEGRALRAAVEGLMSAALDGELADAPWAALASAADAAGERAGAEVRAGAAEAEDDEAERTGQPARRRAREAEELAKRTARRARTASLDLALGLCASWLRDLIAHAEGAGEMALNVDRANELAAAAERVDPRRVRRAGELVMDTRRRLQVNVSETLALEALTYRLEYLLRPPVR